MLPIGTDQQYERTPWATIAIIAFTSLNYILEATIGGWMVPIPLFMHEDIFHIFFNMLFLWFFGSYVESRIGWVRFIIFYFVCEIGTELVSSVLMGQEGIGASGAISGVMAMYLARFYRSKIRVGFGFSIFLFKQDIDSRVLIVYWFLGYDLDSEIPHHSVLSKARRRWGSDLFRTFFERIVLQCVEAGLVEGKKLFMDSSMVDADATTPLPLRAPLPSTCL